MKGFTLLEALLSVALISAIAAVGLPLMLPLQIRNDLDVAKNTMAQAYRRAQAQAQGVDGDISWGVIAQASSIVVFKGINYASRDADFDESYPISPNITPSGLTEIVLAKFTGLPQSTGTLTLTDSVLGETRTLIFNTKGMIEY